MALSQHSRSVLECPHPGESLALANTTCDKASPNSFTLSAINGQVKKCRIVVDIIPDAGLPILFVSLFPLLSCADLTRSRWFAEQPWKENVDGTELDLQRG
jgi:hypothetical protein